MAVNRIEMAQALEYFADKLRRASGPISVDFPAPAEPAAAVDASAIQPIAPADAPRDWAWDTSSGPDPLAKYYQTEEHRNVLMHQFDHYLMVDSLHGEAIPFTDDRWFPATIKQYGSMETYLQVMQEKTGRPRAEIGDIMRGIMLVTKTGVRAWWAQYFATAPAAG